MNCHDHEEWEETKQLQAKIKHYKPSHNERNLLREKTSSKTRYQRILQDIGMTMLMTSSDGLKVGIVHS